MAKADRYVLLVVVLFAGWLFGIAAATIAWGPWGGFVVWVGVPIVLLGVAFAVGEHELYRERRAECMSHHPAGTHLRLIRGGRG